MPLLTAITGLVDAAGTPVAAPRADGTRAALRLKTGTGITATSAPNGGVDEVTLSVSQASATESAPGLLAAADKLRLDNLPIDVTLPPYNAPRSLVGPADPGWAALGDASVAFASAFAVANATGRPIKTPNGYYKLTSTCTFVGNASLAGNGVEWNGDRSTYVWAGGFDETCVDPIPMLKFAGCLRCCIGGFSIVVQDKNHRLAEGIRVASADGYVTPIAIASSTNASPIVLTTQTPHGLAIGQSQGALVTGHQVNTNANNTNAQKCTHVAWKVTALSADELEITSDANTGAVSVGNGVGVATGSISLNTASLSFHNTFHDITIDGAAPDLGGQGTFIEIPIRIGSSLHGGGLGNNDFHRFEDINTRNYGDSAINIQDSQCYGERFEQCRDFGGFYTIKTVFGAGAYGVTTTIGAAINISSSTNATPAHVVTATPHGRVSGDVVAIAGADDPAINGGWVVTSVSPTELTLRGSAGTLVGGAHGTVRQNKIQITDKLGGAFCTQKDVGKVIEIPGADSTRVDGDMRGQIVSVNTSDHSVVLRPVEASYKIGSIYTDQPVLVATSTITNGDVIYGGQCSFRPGSMHAQTGDGGGATLIGGFAGSVLLACYVTAAQGQALIVIGRADDEGARCFHIHSGGNGGSQKNALFESCRIAGIATRRRDPLVAVQGDGHVVYRNCTLGDPDVDTTVSAGGGGPNYDWTIYYGQPGGQFADFIFENCTITSDLANSSASPDPLFPVAYPKFINTKMSRAGGYRVALGNRGPSAGIEMPRFTLDAGATLADTLSYYDHEHYTTQVNAAMSFSFDEFESSPLGFFKPRAGLGGQPMRWRFRSNVIAASGAPFHVTFRAKAGTQIIWLGDGCSPLLPADNGNAFSRSNLYREIEFWYELNGASVELDANPVIFARSVDDVIRCDYVVLVDNATELVMGWPIPKSAISDYEMVKATASHATHYAEWTGAHSVFYLRDGANTITTLGSDKRGTLTGVNGGAAAAELGDMTPDINDATSATWTINVAKDGTTHGLMTNIKNMPAGTKVSIWTRARWRST